MSRFGKIKVSRELHDQWVKEEYCPLNLVFFLIEKVDYEFMYIVYYGYSKFFRDAPELCVPEYVCIFKRGDKDDIYVKEVVEV